MSDDSMRAALATLPQQVEPTPEFATALERRLTDEWNASGTPRATARWKSPSRWFAVAVAVLAGGIGATQLAPAGVDSPQRVIVGPTPSPVSIPAPVTVVTTPRTVTGPTPTTSPVRGAPAGAVPRGPGGATGGAGAGGQRSTSTAGSVSSTVGTTSSDPTRALRVVYTSYDLSTGDGDILMKSVDPNSPAEALTSGDDNDLWPAISPDGTRMVFVRNATVTLFDFMTGATTRLTDNPAYEAFPAWSPDGTQIVFERTDELGVECVSVYCESELFIMNADGTGARSLGLGQHASFTPDGRIVFGRPTGGACSGTNDTSCEAPIYTMNEYGGDVRALGVTGSFPKVSPDGRFVVFEHGDRTNVDIWVSAIDGRGARAITGAESWDGQPAWSPDGSIVYSRAQGVSGAQGVARVNADGSDATVIVRSGTNPAAGLVWIR